jgi:hypothetical protein
MEIDEVVQTYIDKILGKPTPCSHPGRHTVYGAKDPKRNGTRCVVCGEKLN